MQMLHQMGQPKGKGANNSKKKETKKVQRGATAILNKKIKRSKKNDKTAAASLFTKPPTQDKCRRVQVVIVGTRKQAQTTGRK